MEVLLTEYDEVASFSTKLPRDKTFTVFPRTVNVFPQILKCFGT